MKAIQVFGALDAGSHYRDFPANMGYRKGVEMELEVPNPLKSSTVDFYRSEPDVCGNGLSPFDLQDLTAVDAPDTISLKFRILPKKMRMLLPPDKDIF